MNIKQNKGIGLSDGIIAVALLMIFTGVIISISYNIYIQSNFIKRNEQATSIIVQIFEYAQGLIYEDVNEDKLINYINNKYDIVKATKGEYSSKSDSLGPYTVYISTCEKYENYIKELDITVMFKLGNKNKTVNMKTLINK